MVFKIEKQSFKQSLPKVRLKTTVKKFTAELWAIISNQMISYQLPNTRLDQTSDHKHDISLYGKLFTKLLVQAANKNTKFMFTKTGQFLFLKYGFGSDCLEKF